MAMGCRSGSAVLPSSKSSALTATVISSLSSTSITVSNSMTMMRIRRVVLSMLSSVEDGETKRAAHPPTVGSPLHTNTTRHVGGHRLNSDKAREFPEQAQCQKKGPPGDGRPLHFKKPLAFGDGGSQ